MSTTSEKQEEQKVQLYDEATLKSMTRWYDQQIALAKKSKELAEIKAAIAESKVKETFAYTQMASLTAPAPENECDKKVKATGLQNEPPNQTQNVPVQGAEGQVGELPKDSEP